MSSINNCLLCSLCLLGLVLLAGYVAYISFGIIYLIEDYGIANDCKNSNLWEYVLVAVILSTSNIKLDISSNDIFVICFMLFIGIMNLSLSIWGGVELWSLSCDDLSDSNLWKIGLVSCILQLIASIIGLVLTPIILYCNINNFVLKKENTSDNPLQEELPV